MNYNPANRLAIDEEKKAIMWFERALMKLLSSKHWYAPLSNEVTKKMTYDTPTMGVTYRDNQFLMYWNPNLVLSLVKENGEFNQEECVAIVEHEFLHLLLDHIGRGAKYEGCSHTLKNIAADCAINQKIKDIPSWAVQPATMNPPMPLDLCFEEYTDILLDRDEENQNKSKMRGGDGEGEGSSGGDEDNQGGGDPTGQGEGIVDDHSGWDKMTAEERQFQSEKIKNIQSRTVEKLVQAGRGKGGLAQELLKLLQAQIDWKSALRRFTQRTISSLKEFTSTKPSRREWSMPGTKKSVECNLLFAVDVSGSMSDEEINAVYADIYQLQKRYKVGVDVAIFDDGIQLLQKGEKFIKFPRITGGGGTSFDEVVKYADDPKVRKEVNSRLGFKGYSSYDGLVIYSDMYVSAPERPKRVRVMFMSTVGGGESPVDWGYHVKVDIKKRR